ncbi:MAG TPA: 4Fe-4S dicluster domain-containing protein [Armatimonadota bacterium]|nr:4Fe-4S dicluster domain-containing protein [Armatimonadota bacterium]
MRNPFLAIARTGIQTQRHLFPNLPAEATGLPTVTSACCAGCGHCAQSCPTQAITLGQDERGCTVTVDRGRCLGCQRCVRCCPAGTLAEDRTTCTATRTREELVISNRPRPANSTPSSTAMFRRSLHVREVATGDNASDLEVIASTNAMFDVARFGIHFVASPRYADALLVTGPVGRAMREALLRCYEAMAEPRLVIAVGTSAISGGLFRDGYAEANGVTGLLPIAAYVPGDPPHPWSIIHGLLLTMGRDR